MGIFSSKHKASIICIGLDNSGKTTIINKLKPEDEKTQDIQATVALNKETLEYGDYEFNIYDMAGSSRFRNLWEKHYNNISAIIFVIDSSDELRLVSVKYELELLLQNVDVQKKTDIPILFFSNKMDLPKSVNVAELSERLELSKLISNRPFRITRSNALAGLGLKEGMDWLIEHIKPKEDD